MIKKGLNLVKTSTKNRGNMGKIAKILTLSYQVNFELVLVGLGQDVNLLNRVTRTEMRALHGTHAAADSGDGRGLHGEGGLTDRGGGEGAESASKAAIPLL